MPDNSNIPSLQLRAGEIRYHILKVLNQSGSGHLGGSLGLADIFAALYFKLLTHNPAAPLWTERDRLILSAGHLAPVHYVTLALAGYFSISELYTLRQLGSRLQGHPALLHNLPGIETSSGSLGQGLGIGVGMALAAKIKGQNYRTVTIHGDGELQEGSIWEAAMSASHYKLDNLIAVIDRNNLQIDGATEDVMALEPLSDKWRAFGWNVIECNGNQVDNFVEAYNKALCSKGKPTAIIAKTTMGAGVASIENNFQWHGKVPSNDELAKFLSELENKS